MLKQPTTEPSAFLETFSIADLVTRISVMTSRADAIATQFENTLGRLFGSTPELIQDATVNSIYPSPPFKGEFGDAFLALERPQSTLAQLDQLTISLNKL